MIQSLESRTLLSWVNVEQSSIPEHLYEGSQVQFTESITLSGWDYATIVADGQTYSQMPNDDFVFNVDEWVDDNRSFVVTVTDNWNQTDTFSVDVENVAPWGTLSTDVGDNDPDGLVTLGLYDIQEPSQADKDAGLGFAWGYDYAQLQDNWANIGTSDAAHSFDPSLDQDQQYYMRVGDKDGGYSDYSSTLGALPTINLYGEEITSTSVPLHWIDTASGESHWIVQRAEYGGSFSTIATLDGVGGIGSPMSWTDHTCDPDTRYVYRVRAEGNGADTPYSPKKYVSTLLPTPSEVYASNVSGGGNVAEMHWTQPESDHLTGFAISCFNSSGVQIGQAKQVLSSARSVMFSTTDGLSAGGDYTFSVTALSSDGQHDSQASALVQNVDEPTGAYTTKYYRDYGYEYPPPEIGALEWRANGQIVGEGNPFTDETVTVALDNLPRHSFIAGSLGFLLPSSSSLSTANLTVTANIGMQPLRVSIGSNQYFSVDLANSGTGDDALRHTNKSDILTISVVASGGFGSNDYWSLQDANIETYFPFVGIGDPTSTSVTEGEQGHLTLARTGLRNATIAAETLRVDINKLGGDGRATIPSLFTFASGNVHQTADYTVSNNTVAEWTGQTQYQLNEEPSYDQKLWMKTRQ
jgi:hypothetical protein